MNDKIDNVREVYFLSRKDICASCIKSLGKVVNFIEENYNSNISYFVGVIFLHREFIDPIQKIKWRRGSEFHQYAFYVENWMPEANKIPKNSGIQFTKVSKSFLNNPQKHENVYKGIIEKGNIKKEEIKDIKENLEGIKSIKKIYLNNQRFDNKNIKDGSIRQGKIIFTVLNAIKDELEEEKEEFSNNKDQVISTGEDEERNEYFKNIRIYCHLGYLRQLYTEYLDLHSHKKITYNRLIQNTRYSYHFNQDNTDEHDLKNPLFDQGTDIKFVTFDISDLEYELKNKN